MFLPQHDINISLGFCTPSVTLQPDGSAEFVLFSGVSRFLNIHRTPLSCVSYSTVLNNILQVPRVLYVVPLVRFEDSRGLVQHLVAMFRTPLMSHTRAKLFNRLSASSRRCLVTPPSSLRFRRDVDGTVDTIDDPGDEHANFPRRRCLTTPQSRCVPNCSLACDA